MPLLLFLYNDSLPVDNQVTGRKIGTFLLSVHKERLGLSCCIQFCRSINFDVFLNQSKRAELSLMMTLLSFKMLCVYASNMCMCCWKPITKGSVSQHRHCSVSPLMDPSLPSIYTLQPPPPFLCSERRSITPQGPLGPLRFQRRLLNSFVQWMVLALLHSSLSQ